MRRALLRVLLAVAALALGVPIAQASPITLPSGLNPGDTYFLAFVTNGTRDATSSNIADYDAFVTAQANLDADLLALGTTWKVIGSTATVSAATHLGLITSPIYNLAGQLVATGSTDLFDASINSPINYDQFGLTRHAYVWTGSTAQGGAHTPLELGSGRTEIGHSTCTSGGWLAIAGGGDYNDLGPSLYGISGPIVMPVAAVPEPGTKEAFDPRRERQAPAATHQAAVVAHP